MLNMNPLDKYMPYDMVIMCQIGFSYKRNMHGFYEMAHFAHMEHPSALETVSVGGRIYMMLKSTRYTRELLSFLYHANDLNINLSDLTIKYGKTLYGVALSADCYLLTPDNDATKAYVKEQSPINHPWETVYGGNGMAVGPMAPFIAGYHGIQMAEITEHDDVKYSRNGKEVISVFDTLEMV